MGDFAHHLVAALAKMIGHTKHEFDGKVLEEGPERQHDGRRGSDLGPELAFELELILVSDDKALKSPCHFRIELPDVTAPEFDDIDIDQGHVRAVLLHARSGRAADLLEVLRETTGGQRLVGRKLGVVDRAPVGIEKLAEDRLLLPEVVVDAAGRHAGPVSNLACRRRPIPLVRKQIERRLQDLRPAPLRSFLLVHDPAATLSGVTSGAKSNASDLARMNCFRLPKKMSGFSR